MTFDDYRSAAAYLRLNEIKFRNIIKRKAGPKFSRPSPRTILFLREDLDAWKASWAMVSPPPGKSLFR